MDDPRQRNINGNGTLSIPQFNPDAFKVISPLSLGVSLPESAGTEFTSGNNKQNLPFLYDPNKDLQSGIPGSLSEEIRNNESLNPMHRRALRDSDRLGGRSYNFDSKGVPTANREFEASQVSARLLSGGGVSSAESIGNVVSEAGKIREEIKERLERETEFIKGREAEIKRAEAEKTDLARHDRYLGIANLPYTFLHHAFNNRFWKQGIFAEPPTSLCKEQDKRIAEMRSEIDYRKSLVEGLKDSLSRVGTHLDELSETNRALSSETDPRRQLELSRTANTKTHELIRALEKGVGHDDKESKKSWDETRKNLNKSLNALQYQADLAVGVVEGAGKAVVIGGAIGATALTGGTIIPILAGTGVGAGASIGMSGVSLSSNLYFGSSEITLAGEAVKTAHDIKDAALYASGSVLAGAGLSSIARKVGLSRVGQVTTSALLRLGDYSLAKPVQMIMTRSAQSTAMVTKPIGLIFRGWKVGAMTELPAAAVDTYLLSTPDSLDPSGDLRDLKITTLQQQQRQFLFRVGLSAASAGMSYRMQGLKNAINKGPIALIPGLANSGDTILQQAARSPLGVIRRIPGEIVTVVEAPMTAAASLWADAGLTGWYYGTEKSASPEERKKQMQFVMTSALGGHVAGRTVGARVEKIQKARNEALIKADQRLLHHSNTDIRDSLDIVRARNDGAIVSVLASSPHVILSGAEKALGITAKNQKTVAVHVGDTPDLARVESTRQEARVGRRVASMSDNEIGGRIRNYNKPFSDIVEVHTKGRAFGSGGDSTLHSDRDNYQRQLVSTARDRASRLAVIGDVDDHGHAGRLSRYIDTFNNEINPASPRGGSLLDRFLRAVDKAQNPYGRNRAILQTDDIKIDKAVPPGLYAKTVFMFGKWSDAAGTFFNTKLIMPTSDFFNSNRFIPEFLKTPFNAAIGLGSLVYAAPTSSIWGSIGAWGGMAAGGVSILSDTARVGSGLARIGLESTGLGRRIFNRGSGFDAADLQARVREGNFLLEQAHAANARTPGSISDQQIRAIQQEVNLANRLFDRANARYSGLFGMMARGNAYFYGRMYKTGEPRANGAEVVPGNERVTLDRHLDRLFRSSSRSQLRQSMDDACDRAVECISMPVPPLGETARAIRTLLSRNSVANDTRQGQYLRTMEANLQIRLGDPALVHGSPAHQRLLEIQNMLANPNRAGRRLSEASVNILSNRQQRVNFSRILNADVKDVASGRMTVPQFENQFIQRLQNNQALYGSNQWPLIFRDAISALQTLPGTTPGLQGTIGRLSNLQNIRSSTIQVLDGNTDLAGLQNHVADFRAVMGDDAVAGVLQRARFILSKRDNQAAEANKQGLIDEYLRNL